MTDIIERIRTAIDEGECQTNVWLMLDEAEGHIAELERIMKLTHDHSRKHTPGYCTVRQSDIDAIGDVIYPQLPLKENTHKLVNSLGEERGRGSLEDCEALAKIADCSDYCIVKIEKETT